MDLVRRSVAGSKHYDRHPTTLAPELLQYPDAIHARQHDVQNNHRGLELQRGLQSRRSVVGAPHHEPPVLQLKLEEPGYGAVIFYDENTCSGFHIPSRALLDILPTISCGSRFKRRDADTPAPGRELAGRALLNGP
jgi:hypothetical protein